MKTYLYRASNLKSIITFLASVSWPKSILAPAKNHHFLLFIHNNYHFRQVFSECTETITTSLIPLDIILPVICAFIIGFIIGFSCTVWTIMRSLACSLVDGVLADAILFSPCYRPPI